MGLYSAGSRSALGATLLWYAPYPLLISQNSHSGNACPCSIWPPSSMRSFVGLFLVSVTTRLAEKAAFSFFVNGAVMVIFPCASMRAPRFVTSSFAVSDRSPPE